MSAVPNIYEMDPDDWYDEVQREAEELKRHLRRALDETETLEELKEAVQPHLQPYIVDPDEPIHAEQILAEIKYGEKLCIGVKEGDWMALTPRPEGYWWFDGAEPREGDGSREALHDYIAGRVVTATNWGDEKLARQRANEQKEHREIAEPYLKQLQEVLEAGEATAAALREPFHRLLNGCLDPDTEVVVADVSPDDHHTRVRLRHDSELFAEILGVDPGESLDLGELADQFGLDEEDRQRVAVVTDHRHFRWPAAEHARGTTLRLPSEKDDDPAGYHRGADWLVRHLREVIAPPEDDG